MFDAPDLPDIGDFISWKLILIVIILCILRQYLKGAQFSSKENCKNKNVIVTGANCGIGKQIVRELVYRGGTVIMGCRDLNKGEDTRVELLKMGCSPDRMILLQLDLSSFKSVRAFVEQVKTRFKQLDILICNAGIMMYPNFKLTEDNHELHWQVNYLGHFLLTELLLPTLKCCSGEARIVHTSANAHFAAHLDLDLVDRKEGYEPREAYSRSKLALVMHARHLTTVLRQSGSNVIINACNPGICDTRLFRHTPLTKFAVLRYPLAPLIWYLAKTPKDGSQCPLYCSLSSKVAGNSGKYFSECKEIIPAEQSLNAKACEELYKYSKKAAGLD